jgi:branched-chain amino acid transport system permease protein
LTDGGAGSPPAGTSPERAGGARGRDEFRGGRGAGMQLVVNGAASGAVVAVLALAFQLVYLPTRVFHFAMAALFAAAPFVTWQALQEGVPRPLALALGVLATILLSLLAEAANHGPIARRQGSFSAQLIASIGFYIIVVQIVAVVWGNDPKVLRTGSDPVIAIGSVVITAMKAWQLAGCAAIVLAFFGWLFFTRVGLLFRGLADNPRELAIRGHNVRRLRLLAFGISGGMIGLVAILGALDTGFYSYSGLPMLLLSVVAAIIGGRHSFFGAVIGGVLLGLVRAEVEWYLSPRWLDVATFVLLVLFLLFRPQGILARQARLEAAA